MTKEQKAAQQLIENPVFIAIAKELGEEAFAAWQRSEGFADREAIFFRMMAISDIIDTIKLKAQEMVPLEVVS